MSDQGPPPGGDEPADAPAAAVPAKKAVKAKKAAPKKAAIGPGRVPPTSAKAPAKKAAPTPDDAGATMRGMVVIAVTVVVGLIVFVAGLNKGEQSVSTSSNTTTTLNTPTTDRNAPPVVTKPEQGTTVPPKPPPTKVPPADIKVAVVNAVDPSQTIAGPNATKLKNEKYNVVSTGDAPTTSEKSYVYFNGDLAAEAAAIASVLGIPSTQVMPMPASPPVQPANGAQVLVVIGKDKA